MPLTWELPAAAALAWMSVVALLLPAGRGASAWLTGGLLVFEKATVFRSRS